MTNANAPVETRHLDMAANKTGYDDWAHMDESDITQDTRWSATAHAQSLANLEAANNRLSEIDAIISKLNPANILVPNYVHSIAALASGHTDGSRSGGQPPACPGCAAKDEAMAVQERISDDLHEALHNADEAMAAFKADVSASITDYLDHDYRRKQGPKIKNLSRFIIPPSDPVAEALQNLIALARPHFTDDAQMIALEQASVALAELRGAK